MKPKRIHRIIIDWLMMVLLMAQMGRHLWGPTAHEWIGAGMFGLFIVHQALNITWYKTMFRGRYTPSRILRLIINVLAFTAMAGLMVSGIMLSQQIFAFLPVSGGKSFARILHMLASYWAFVLMALHLGLHWTSVTRWHWEMTMGTASKVSGTIRSPSALSIVLNIAGVVLAGYGIYAFINRDLFSYMLMQNRFVFLDYEESKILFYLDYLSIIGFFIWIAHNAVKLMRDRSAGKKNGSRRDGTDRWEDTAIEESRLMHFGSNHSCLPDRPPVR